MQSKSTDTTVTTAVATVLKSFKPTATVKTLDLEASNKLYMELSDLVNENFKLWYLKMFNRLGYQQVLHLASQARADGKNPRKLFSFLLKGSRQ